MSDPAVFVIAEAGVNHNGQLDLALALCDAAKAAGADAVKFQTFRAADLVVPDAPTAEYQQRQTGAMRQFEMLQRLELDEAAHRDIAGHCRRIGIEFFSTPFSLDAVDLLVRLGVRRVKLSSGELTNKPLVVHAARTGLDLLMSTGMADMAEVRQALQWVRSVRPALDHMQVLHCTSAYPAPDDTLNLQAMVTMARDLNVPVGYSDHSLGLEAPIAAVALGARVIEKHLTLDRGLPGPDHAASLEPAAFADMVRAIRRVSAMLGDGVKRPHPSESGTAAVARRSVVAVHALPRGLLLEPDMLTTRRPGHGIAPAELESLVGRRLRCDVAAGGVLQWDMVEGGPP